MGYKNPRPKLRTKKHLGQHLLIDPWVIEAIINSIGLSENDHIIEIGPGAGAITAPLINKAAHVCAIEVDSEAVALLHHQYQTNDTFSLLHQDVLKTNLSHVFQETRARIVGNLPYNLSSPIIFHILEHTTHIQDAHIMVQKEVAERMAAQPGTKAYGRLSLGVQIRCQVEKLFDIGPEAFHPPPKVQSSFVRLTPKCKNDLPVNLCLFEKVVKQSFIHRRKKLSNNLKGWLDKTVLESIDIDPSCRAETLTIDQFIALTKTIAKIHP